MKKEDIIYCFDSQSIVPEAASGNMPDMQIIRTHPWPIESEILGVDPSDLCLTQICVNKPFWGILAHAQAWEPLEWCTVLSNPLHWPGTPIASAVCCYTKASLSQGRMNSSISSQEYFLA